MSGYNRSEYIDFLKQYKNREMVKVLTGMRGSGKTAILESFILYLEESGVASGDIVALDLSDPAVQRLFPASRLYSYILEHAPAVRPTYIFLDEVQELPDFPELADRLFRIQNYDLYLAGSGLAAGLPRLREVLPGRCAVKTVYPLSFRESAAALDQAPTVDDLLTYTARSTLPGVWHREVPRRELDPIISAALFHEVLSDAGMRWTLLMKLLPYLSPRTGDLIDLSVMAKDTGRAGRPLLHKTLLSYLHRLAESGILLPMPCRDLDTAAEPPRDFQWARFFFPDPAMMCLWGEGYELPRRQLMNAAAVEMLRRAGQVWAGRSAAGTVDFVTEESGIRTAWQLIPNPSAVYARPKWETLCRLPGTLRKRVLTGHPEAFERRADILVTDLFSWFLPGLPAAEPYKKG